MNFKPLSCFDEIPLGTELFLEFFMKLEFVFHSFQNLSSGFSHQKARSPIFLDHFYLLEKSIQVFIESLRKDHLKEGGDPCSCQIFTFLLGTGIVLQPCN